MTGSRACGGCFTDFQTPSGDIVRRRPVQLIDDLDATLSLAVSISGARTAMPRLVARLDDAITADTAGAMASSRLRHRSDEDTRYPRVQRVDVAPLHEARGPLPSREALVALWMGGVSILVFLIACANAAGLLAARAAARRDTVSLLPALGASRLRAARILASEPMVIAALAAALAVPLAASAARVLSWETGGDMVVNSRLIAPLIGLLVASILLGAILPVAQLWRTRAASLLKTPAVAGRAIPGEGPCSSHRWR